MSKLQSFRIFINQRLTAAAVEIFEAVEKTVEEYQEENDRLRRMLRITPEIKLCRIDSLKFSVSEENVPPEQQHCEQEWSPSLGQEDPEPTQIKEEQEELRISQEEEQLQGFLDTKDSILTPLCVKSECDQENPLWSLTEAQTQTEENRESDSKPVDLKPAGTVIHVKGLDTPCVPLDIQNNSISNISNDKLVPSTCKETFNGKNTFSSGDCGKTFELKGNLTKPNDTHTGEKPFSCVDCGKTFSHMKNLIRHKRIHTGEKPFSCGECGRTFSRNRTLINHKHIHTGEKPFICGECGKTFIHKKSFIIHKLVHSGEKPFSCGDCGKTFIHKKSLIDHKHIHTGKKPFSCGECGRTFRRKNRLIEHARIHTGEKPFSCGDCGKTFSHRSSFIKHQFIHNKDK